MMDIYDPDQFPSVASVLADTAIQDYFIHQAVVYRLYFLQGDIEEGERRLGLTLAFSYAKAADQIIRHLNELVQMGTSDNGTAPLSEKARLRRLFGRTIGRAFFHIEPGCSAMNEDSGCFGPCCEAHCLAKWRSVIQDLLALPIPPGEHASLFRLLLDMKTAIIVHGNQSMNQWMKGVDELFEPRRDGSPQESPQNSFLELLHKPTDEQMEERSERLRAKLVERREQLLGYDDKRQFGSFVEKLGRRYPLKPIQRDLLNWIRMCHAQASLDLPDVLVAANRMITEMESEPEPDAHNHVMPASPPKGASVKVLVVNPTRYDTKSSEKGIRQISTTSPPKQSQSPTSKKVYKSSPLRLPPKISPSHQRESLGSPPKTKGITQEANDGIPSMRTSPRRKLFKDEASVVSEEDSTTEEDSQSEEASETEHPKRTKMEHPSTRGRREGERRQQERSRKDFGIDDWLARRGLHHHQARASNTGDSSTRKRRPFSAQETAWLIEGVRKYGRDWKRIREEYHFEGRTNVDLKDKARNLVRADLL